MKKSEFRFKGKNLGLKKLKILELAYGDIKDHDIEYAIIDNNGELVDTTDWVGFALEVVSAKYEDKKLRKEVNAPWHIEIINPYTNKEISKKRFRELFSDALLLGHRKKRKSS